MPRPSTLPEPWRSLATRLGGVSELAKALGTVPRTINDWAMGTRTPRGPAWLLIQKVFTEAGLPIPSRQTPERRSRMNAQRFIDEITMGFVEYRSAVDFLADGGGLSTARYRAADALARVEAAGIAIERAAYAALLEIADVDRSGVPEARSRCNDLQKALEGPLEVLVTQISRGTAPDDDQRQWSLQRLRFRRDEAMAALKEAHRNLDRIESRITEGQCR